MSGCFTCAYDPSYFFTVNRVMFRPRVDNHQDYRTHKAYRSPAPFVLVRIHLCCRKRVLEYEYSRFKSEPVYPPVRLVLLRIPCPTQFTYFLVVI